MTLVDEARIAELAREAIKVSVPFDKVTISEQTIIDAIRQAAREAGEVAANVCMAVGLMGDDCTQHDCSRCAAAIRERLG